jgi:quercetin dioxygenase-like cupin family protein
LRPRVKHPPPPSRRSSLQQLRPPPCSVASLLGSKLYRAAAGKLVAPLLDPATTGLPFGAYLELSTASGDPDAAAGQDAQHAPAVQPVVQLSFVLAGQGLLHQGSQQPAAVAAGHTVLGSLSPRGPQLQPLPGDQQQGLMVLKLLLPHAMLHGSSCCADGELAAVAAALPAPRHLPLAGEVTPAMLAAMHSGGAGLLAGRASSSSSSSLSRSSQGQAAPPASSAAAQAAAGPDAPAAEPVHSRSMDEVAAYELPGQSNRMALVFGPSNSSLSLTFGLEVFPQGHTTPVHLHAVAHELFFVLSGHGEAVCEGARWAVGPGSVVVFPPGVLHGLDNAGPGNLYCLQMMLPNEEFGELVESGRDLGRLGDEELCHLFALRC